MFYILAERATRLLTNLSDKTKVTVYGIAGGLTRGVPLLAMPFLLTFLTAPEYGQWSLAYLSATLFSPLVSLGGVNSILRDGAETEGAPVAFALLAFYGLVTLGAGLLLAFIGSLVELSSYLIVTISFATGFAWFELINACARAVDDTLAVIIASFLRLLSILGPVATAWLFSWTLHDLMIAQGVSVVTLSLLSGLKYRDCLNQLYWANFSLRRSFLFGIKLLPHSSAQWALNSSDKFLVYWILGATKAGIYAAIYNLASTLVLLITAISLFLQPALVRNYDEWTAGGKLVAWYGGYQLLAVGMFLATCALLVGGSVFEVPMLKLIFSEFGSFALIFTGIFFLGIYSLHVPWLYYHRRSFDITVATMGAAIINCILTLLLASKHGILGAAAATVVAFFTYAATTVALVKKIEPNFPKIALTRGANLIFPCVVLVCYTFYRFYNDSF